MLMCELHDDEEDEATNQRAAAFKERMQFANGRRGHSGQLPPTGSSEYTEQAVGGLKPYCDPAQRCIRMSDGHFTGTPPSYGYDADRAEEQRRHHDILPYIDDSPSSSPHLSSKSRSSRDTLSSGSLESSKSESQPAPVNLMDGSHLPINDESLDCTPTFDL
ncbi:unnamed protein product [Pleuronectes platessa]|uniref:Uncharacterized protein n=1 Tax=Pleuronectes platessa TaxID=8262 RepID=A0A9N7V8G5_PLEPL|nr:unnamed protein product [Pleuronectes platessa]